MAIKSPAHRCADCSRNDGGTCDACKLAIGVACKLCIMTGWRPAQRISDYSQYRTDDETGGWVPMWPGQDRQD